MENQLSPHQQAKKRLIWRCRRGSKELDTILSKFVEFHFDQLTNDELQWFTQLLECADPQLTDWLCNGFTPTDQGLANIVKRILSTHHA